MIAERAPHVGDAAAADAAIDLTTCDREPIHHIGHVQPHGALLVLSGPELGVRHASASAAALLGVAPDAVLGEPLAALLGDAQAARVAVALEAGAGRADAPVRVTAAVHGVRRRFEGALHPVEGGVALELEPAPTDEPMGVDEFATLVRATVARVERAATLTEAGEAVAEEVRALTGYDRVWVYRFHEDWHGEVIAESRAASVRESWLGLHYPASDIPAPARRLFLRQPLRLIVDVAYVPSPIVPAEDPITGAPLDLGDCVLRGVSPVHLQYLRNMGVRASMSISLVRNGALWGLISCHHYAEPRVVGRDVRAACDLLGQAFSGRLAAAEALAAREHALRVQVLRARLAERVADADDPLAALVEEGEGSDAGALLDVVGAQGAVVVARGVAASVGQAPPADAVAKLTEWLRATGQEVASTDALPAAYPPAAAWASVATGLLAVSLGGDDWVLWFRPERRQTVAWGGDPRKPATTVPGDGGGTAQRLSPRGSFERWEEEVRGRSAPWDRLDLDVAAALRAMLVEALLRRAARVDALNRELTRSNEELDAFAFVAAHDLKEPLRGIRNYAEMLREDHGEALGEDVARLSTIARLASRLDTMIGSLFDFSRVGRLELALADVPLMEVVEDALERLAVAPGRDRVAVAIPRPLPVVRADRERITEVYFNLLSNAMKYSDRGGGDGWVELSFEDAGDGPPVFRVRDNGIGIEARHHDAVWRLYKRLHPRDAYGGGTGAGLTIVRRIVERHGGRVWLDSVPGEGTTVSFTLAPPPAV